MPELNISIPHQLSQQEALQRVKTLLEKVTSQHGDKISNLQQEWTDNKGVFSFLVMGFSVSGALAVHESTVELNSDIPLAAVLFKNKIKSVIEEEGGKLLA
ncbi:MAG: polyhydroxyalkanoic acid system family protein [Bacteroidota bacterium]